LSPQIQNELIAIIGGRVKSEILTHRKEAKFYSILFDCTPDTSRKEQMTQIIRYVQIKDGECSIEESFIDFIESHEKTGHGLALDGDNRKNLIRWLGHSRLQRAGL